MVIELRRRSWTVDEYDRMIAAGVFADDERCELIDGEIIEMSPIGGRHSQCVDRLTATIASVVGRQGIVRIQGPIRLSERSEPQPDLSLLRWRDDFYPLLPRPDDVLLFIEVADSSSRFDRHVKFPAYARAGIAESWLVDVTGNVVEVHTDPVAGAYAAVRVARPGDTLDVRGLAGVTVDVAALLA